LGSLPLLPTTVTKGIHGHRYPTGPGGRVDPRKKLSLKIETPPEIF
jgi:hypothetical protein